MVSTSKILTVSYGTFSCTLEGFDDSFDTMKAIAEYFRDLAADDRYFGAEPPTPDAEMLARIAEREVSRRVEAHEEGSNIVLRAGGRANAADDADAENTPPEARRSLSATAHEEETVTTPADETAQPLAWESEPQTESRPEPAPETGLDPEQRIADEEAPEPDAAEEPEPLTATEHLSGTDTPVAAEAWPEPEVKPQPAADEAEADPHADDLKAPGTAEADATEDDELGPTTPDSVLPSDEAIEAPEGVYETADRQATHPAPYEADHLEHEIEEVDMDVAAAAVTDEIEIQEQSADLAATESGVSPSAEDDVFVDHPDPDSIAAKLRRIRSVVSQSEGVYHSADYTEDEHAQDFLSSTAADLDAALSADDAQEETRNSSDQGQSRAWAEIPEDAGDEPDEIVAAPEAAMPAEASEADTGSTGEDDAGAHEFGESSEFEDTLAQLMADAMPEEVSQDMSDDPEPEDIAEDMPEAELDVAPDRAEDAARPLDARVIKMKRSEFDAAIAGGELEEESGTEADGDDDRSLFDEDTSGDDRPASDSALSPEDEAELQRELAEVEAEFSPEATVDAPDHTRPAEHDTPADPSGKPEAESEEPRGRDKLQRAEEDSDVSRIFKEADNQLDEPESSRRRSAVQHLRAAVAATRAEKQAGSEMRNDVDDTPYRSDLASVVQPRRPRQADGPRSERPSADDRPAPLKLVAEQRIDMPHEPVRPRRVNSGSDSLSPDDPASGADSGFSTFAETMGATTLPELLEAAAAYMSDVEGRPQFSRPMLMGKLKEASPEAYSREEGLRSFGLLLRRGKLQKLKGGRFSVTETTEFRADERNVG